MVIKLMIPNNCSKFLLKSFFAANLTHLKLRGLSREACSEDKSFLEAFEEAL